jgi:hypothetical protein
MDTVTLRARLSAKTTEELVELLRVRDADEWQPAVFGLAENILRGRGVTPPTPAPGPAAEPAHEDERVPVGWRGLTTVAIFDTVIAADACCAALRSAGFRAIILNEHVLQQDLTLAPLTDWVRVAVPEEEGPDASTFVMDSRERRR